MLAGCGSGPDRIPEPLAEQLARRSEAIAASLDHGDSCLAATRSRALRADVRDAIAAGEVPEPLRAPLRTAVSRLASRIVCEPPPAVDEHGGGDGEDRPGNGKGRGKKRGHER